MSTLKNELQYDLNTKIHYELQNQNKIKRMHVIYVSSSKHTMSLLDQRVSFVLYNCFKHSGVFELRSLSAEDLNQPKPLLK